MKSVENPMLSSPLGCDFVTSLILTDKGTAADNVDWNSRGTSLILTDKGTAADEVDWNYNLLKTPVIVLYNYFRQYYSITINDLMNARGVY